jgi:protein phosphatase 1 regulatory subunit 37
MNSDIVHQARDCVEGLKHVLSMPSSERASDLNLVANQASTLIHELTRTIEATTNPQRLQELLQVNDELIEISAKVPQAGRPVLRLQGLGLSGENRQLLSGDLHSGSNANGTVLYENGQAIHDSPVEDSQDDAEPTTPRIDKGKAKAEPEPEEPEKILSPNFLISEDEEEDDGSRPIRVVEVDDRPSPTDRLVVEISADCHVTEYTLLHRSKSWVEEEGEVFRKGTQLLRPEDFEADYAGEDLRKEVGSSLPFKHQFRIITDSLFGNSFWKQWLIVRHHAHLLKNIIWKLSKKGSRQ